MLTYTTLTVMVYYDMLQIDSYKIDSFKGENPL